jgi:hypothetical protein
LAFFPSLGDAKFTYLVVYSTTRFCQVFPFSIIPLTASRYRSLPNLRVFQSRIHADRLCIVRGTERIMKSASLILIPYNRAYFIPTEHKLFDKSGGISIGFIERSF